MALFFIPLTTVSLSPALTAALGGLTGAGLSEPAALAQVTRMIEQQAYTRAADDIFLASALMFLLLIGLIWLTTRPPRAAAAGAAAVDATSAH